jgi:hypothetical protein
MTSSADALVARLDAAEARLAAHAGATPPMGLTDPDPGGVERWEAGQVWAHLAEFPGFWRQEAQRIVDSASDEPVPFGRMKTDAGRVGAIERDRGVDVDELMLRLRRSLIHLRESAENWPDSAWERRGLHPTRGEMTVHEIVERFVVEHLEEHADQLDALHRGS